MGYASTDTGANPLPDSSDEARAALRERVVKACESSEPLCILGGGSKHFYGREPVGETLSTRGCRGIVEYEAAELVISVRAGTTLAEVEEILARERQMLAFEPPHFDVDTTIGGALAAGLSGPRRPYAGAVRDAVLGVEVLSGSGEILHFGGRVMKNVAGYDVARLMTGAMGTLGIILSASLRVAPRPAVERTVTWRMEQTEAHAQMIAMARQPWPISAMAFEAGYLRLRLSGHGDAVDEAIRELAPDLEGDTAYWFELRDHATPFFRTAAPLWRVSLPPAAQFDDADGTCLIDWGGAIRWLKSDAPMADIRARARAAGGSACLFRGAREQPFAPLEPASLALHKRLKQTFDPRGILNRGRMYADY